MKAPAFRNTATWRWRRGAIRAAIVVLGAIALVPAARLAAPPATAQESRTQLVLDMSVHDGRPCEVIDELAVIDPGDTLQVAVCVFDAPEPIAAVTYTLFYDERVVLAPNIGKCDGNLEEGEVASIEESLDCNPDANAGETTFGEESLGEGWDCSAEGLAEPWGNRSDLPTGDAFNGACISIAGPYPGEPVPVMAMVTFRGVAPGRTAVVPVNVQLAGAITAADLGSCLPHGTLAIDCRGGVISVRGPEEGGTAADDGDQRWLAVAAVAGVVAVAVAGVGLGAWRRRPRGAS